MELSNELSFHRANALARLALAKSIASHLSKTNVCPIVVCIGSDRVPGDSLGPVVGTMLEEKRTPAYLYGTLRSPMTAREIAPLQRFLERTHPGAPVIAVDAAVGKSEEVGLIKLNASPLYPGSGAQKQLGSIGDVSLLGIVAGREEGFPALERVRYSDVYAMACVLKEALLLVLEQRDRLYASLSARSDPCRTLIRQNDGRYAQIV